MSLDDRFDISLSLALYPTRAADIRHLLAPKTRGFTQRV